MNFVASLGSSFGLASHLTEMTAFNFLDAVPALRGRDVGSLSWLVG